MRKRYLIYTVLFFEEISRSYCEERSERMLVRIDRALEISTEYITVLLGADDTVVAINTAMNVIV